MKNQCSPHTIYDGAELLLRKVNRMTGFTIVIGEPDEDNFEKLKLEFLNFKKDFRVAQERDGKMLLQYLSAKINYSRQLPDLILLNLNMPVVNGTETLELMRNNEMLSTIPVIVYRFHPDHRLETVMMSRGKQNIQLSGFVYSELKSFVVELNRFLLQMLPGSGHPPEQTADQNSNK